MSEIVVRNKSLSIGAEFESVCPAVVREAGEKASYRFVEFFVSEIKNKNTRRAYLRALQEFFDWVDAGYGLSLEEINSLVVGLYRGMAPIRVEMGYFWNF